MSQRQIQDNFHLFYQNMLKTIPCEYQSQPLLQQFLINNLNIETCKWKQGGSAKILRCYKGLVSSEQATERRWSMFFNIWHTKIRYQRAQFDTFMIQVYEKCILLHMISIHQICIFQKYSSTIKLFAELFLLILQQISQHHAWFTLFDSLTFYASLRILKFSKWTQL